MASLNARDRALFTSSEAALIDATMPPASDSLSPSRVIALIGKIRKYWDKYRMLSRTGARSQKTSRRAAGDAPKNRAADLSTARKAELMADALRRLETRADRPKEPRGTSPANEGGRSTAGSKGHATQSEALNKRAQRRRAASMAASEMRPTRHFQKTSVKATQGHIRARGQRRQAKRDAK
jgi:hypothetical protein